MKKLMKTLLCACLLGAFATAPVLAEDAYKPYVLAGMGPGDTVAKKGEVKAALEGAGFEVVGEYTPYNGAHILIVTGNDLKAAAAKSDFGAYGAALRVSVTQVKDQVQVAYNNPPYMANMYHMADTLDSTAAALEKALGRQSEFGVEKAMNAKDLRGYHYMFAMPYFDDHLKLAEYDNHQAALDAVEKGLTASKTVNKIYRVDVPGKEESVFGVSILDGNGADKAVMAVTDTNELRHTAHLPYEFIVSGKTAYLLHGKFRIAQSFPDLGMGTFMSISGAPDAIELAVKSAIK